MEKDPNINEELEGLSPFLSKLPKKEGYKVPYQYFEVLPDQIMEQLNPAKEEPAGTAAPSEKWSVLGWFAQWRSTQRALALASFLILVIAGWTIFSTSTSVIPNNADALASNITSSDAASYIANNLEDFDLDLLAEDMNTSIEETDVLDLDQEELQQYIEDEFLDDLDDDTLEEFL